MAAEGVFPKQNEDILYASEVNAFNNIVKNKTSYWSCAGVDFIPKNPDTDSIHYINQVVEADETGRSFYAPIFLPHGAIITAVKVFGNDPGAVDESWTLYRNAFVDGVTSSMAAANINTEDTSISYATIDNNNYSYAFRTSTLDDGDEVWGARIKYTTNYI